MTSTLFHVDDRIDTSIVDNLPTLPRGTRITYTRSLEASLFMAEKDMIPLKFPKLSDTLKL